MPQTGRASRADGGAPLATRAFSSYDLSMVSEEQIEEWTVEAEQGYDVDELKRRGRGRPGRGAEPMQVVAVRLTAEELNALDAAAAAKDMSRSVRLTAEELNALDAAAAAKDMSRSEAIRAALAHFAA